jgi:hypothetical protein
MTEGTDSVSKVNMQKEAEQIFSKGTELAWQKFLTSQTFREKNPFAEDFVQRLANDFHFDFAELNTALQWGYFRYHEVRELVKSVGNRNLHASRLKSIHHLCSRALGEWRRLPPETQKIVTEYRATYEENLQRFDPFLDGVLESLEEFIWISTRNAGNPGTARKHKRHEIKPALDLRPFHAFADVMLAFWKSRGLPFGHQTAADYSRPESHPVFGDLNPKSPAFVFFMKCAKRLDRKIRVESCETLIRKAKQRAKGLACTKYEESPG